MRTTHTYAELEVSAKAYDEIRAKLEAAGYQHAFMDDGTIDMHGIGVTKAVEKEFVVGERVIYPINGRDVMATVTKVTTKRIVVDLDGYAHHRSVARGNLRRG